MDNNTYSDNSYTSKPTESNQEYSHTYNAEPSVANSQYQDYYAQQQQGGQYAAGAAGAAGAALDSQGKSPVDLRSVYVGQVIIQLHLKNYKLISKFVVVLIALLFYVINILVNLKDMVLSNFLILTQLFKLYLSTKLNSVVVY
ncbi:unnamed protein product [Cunninghamella echinulata]